MKKTRFITGTGTGVGKTLITCALAHQYTQGGYGVAAYKPVVSGFADDDPHSDPALILQSLGKAATPEAINAISPWRFTAPLSPHMAAWQEGNAPSAAMIAEFCRRVGASADVTLAEGAGGVMTPINDRETMLDVCALLGWPVVLAAGTYLGSLSHTLTALRALAHAQLRVQAVIISESENNAVPLADAARSIRPFAEASTTLYTVPRLSARHDLWKHLPPLTV